jgi:small-conductance mechanosensitive channel
MRRLLLLPLLLLTESLSAAGAAQSEGDWSGTWHTYWRDMGGYMIMEQRGDSVTGRYPLYDGRFEGKVRAYTGGPRLEGRWSVGARSGEFIAVLSRDGSTFTGRIDEGEWWTGVRIRQPPISLDIGLRSPRNALTTFVVAGNVARGGQDDVWGIAADAVEFGPEGNPTIRPEQLLRVRDLFALIDLTTFRFWTIPDAPPGADTLALRLEQVGSNVALKLIMHKDDRGNWRIVLPSADEMRAAREELLAVHGGKPPAADAFRRLQNPRDTMRAFLEGMADWDGPGRALALSTLDLSELPEILRRSVGESKAQFLRRALEHIGLVGLQSIPDDGASRAPYVHFVHSAGRIVIAPTAAGTDARWQFNAATVADIRNIYRVTESLPPPVATPPGAIPDSLFFTIRGHVAKSAPYLLGRVGDTEYWQVLAGLLVLTASIVVACIGASLICRGLRRLPGAGTHTLRFFWSLVILLVLVMLRPLPDVLGIGEVFREYSLPFWGTVGCIAGGLVGWYLLQVFGRYLTELAARTEKPTDDILVTLLLAGARLGIIIASALGIAFFLSIPTIHLLAGLSIGGLAVAFASRETLSNLFGAGILVTDRPFRRGDWIKTGDIEGSVEHVGIRSTRVRTAQDSVVFVPNGRLVDSTINNLGSRRYRLVKLQLVVTAGGTAQKLEAFSTAVRELITKNPAYFADRTDVAVAGIGQSGITVDVMTYLRVDTDGAESAARHALLLEITRIAGQVGLALGSGMARPGT